MQAGLAVKENGPGGPGQIFPPVGLFVKFLTFYYFFSFEYLSICRVSILQGKKLEDPRTHATPFIIVCRHILWLGQWLPFCGRGTQLQRAAGYQSLLPSVYGQVRRRSYLWPRWPLWFVQTSWGGVELLQEGTRVQDCWVGRDLLATVNFMANLPLRPWFLRVVLIFLSKAWARLQLAVRTVGEYPCVRMLWIWKIWTFCVFFIWGESWLWVDTLIKGRRKPE